MTLTRHCALCENESKNLENAVICELTCEKPDFEESCSQIFLDKKFQSKLELVNLELEKAERAKKQSHFVFYILLIIGFLFIIGSKRYAEFFSETPYYWYHRIAMLASGIAFIMVAYNRYVFFRNKIKIAKFNKNRIDDVLNNYGISYKSSFEYIAKIHETPEVKVTLEFENLVKKQTITSYK